MRIVNRTIYNHYGSNRPDHFHEVPHGQVVRLTLVETAGFFHSVPFPQLISPTGVLVTSLVANEARQVTLPADGTYVIQAMANNLLDTGSYNVGVECIRPVDPVNFVATCGSLITSTIATQGEVDQIAYGTAGQIVALLLIESAGLNSNTPFAQMISPTGASLTSLVGNNRRIVTLPADGTYVLQVMANNLLDTGTYKLGLECIRPPAPVNAAFPCGGLLQRSMTVPGQVDQFTFTRQAGNIVTLTLVERAGFFSSAPFAQVFAPNGTAIQSFVANSQRRFAVPATGTYVVQVMANNLLHGILQSRLGMRRAYNSSGRDIGMQQLTSWPARHFNSW